MRFNWMTQTRFFGIVLTGLLFSSALMGAVFAQVQTKVTGGQAEFKMDPQHQSQNIRFTQRPVLTRTNDKLKQTVQADTLDMGSDSEAFKAVGNVKTQISGDTQAGKVSIQSASQVFDQASHTMRASGNVVITKEDMTASSPEAIIFLNAGGSAEKAVFLKGATLKQGEQEMRAQTITINISTGDIYAEQNAVSTVMGKDDQGNETQIKVNSHLQEFDKKSGTLLANGNAQIQYDDYLASGPKATFYRVNNQLDHIVLTGRAQIEDNERKVTGDTVTITVNPRQFNAKGNVTSFIKTQPKAASGVDNSKTTKGAKAAVGKAGATKSAAKTSVNKAPSALDQELMIEKMTREANKAQ